MSRCIGILLIGLAGLLFAVNPAFGKKGPTYDNPKAAGKDADFAVQGEYAGIYVNPDGEKEKVGVQVIALGKGKFRLVAYSGGLPGAGWDKTDKLQLEGGRVDGVPTFKNNDGEAVIKNGVMYAKASDGGSGKFKRIMRKSPTLGAKPPKGAKVLFNGKDVKAWRKGAKMTKDGLLMQGVMSVDTFQSHRLHIEFRTPYQPEARGQGRGNSGLYLQGRYEVQMLDSFGLEGKNNECGGIYSVAKPKVNMCLPPLTWQTYDVEFTAAKFENGKKVANAKITVRHNGVIIHKDQELPRSTAASRLKEGAGGGPVYLQNHGNPVRYRNIWVVEK